MRCLWVLRELAARTEAQRIYEPDEAAEVQAAEQRAAVAGQTPRRTDHVDVFVVRDPVEPVAQQPQLHEGENAGNAIADPRVVLRRLRATIRAAGDHPSETTLLRRVVSSHERLKDEGRAHTEMLTIQGGTRTFHEWFRMVSLYGNASGRRIWSGGASVRRGPDAYQVTFYDKVAVEPRRFVKPTITLPFDLLDRHRRGPFLREVVEGRLDGRSDYIKPYWYGVLVPDGNGMIPDIGDDLDRLHIAPRYRRPLPDQDA